MVQSAIPGARIIAAESLTEGRRNVNFKVTLCSSPTAVVLRIYQHDPSLCRKEADLTRMVRSCVPVPDVIHVEPNEHGECPPFILMRYIEGISLRDLLKRGDLGAIAEASHSAGETLAHIGSFRFNKGGWLGPGAAPGPPLLEGADPIPRFIDACLGTERLQSRLRSEWRDRTHALVWSSRDAFAQLAEERCLVHGDFNKRNLLAAQDRGHWKIAAVLDWEFAVSGSCLGDFGNLLRYEKRSRPLIEPHLSTGFISAGGSLPSNWLRLARLLDLIALCESLTRDELPGDVVAELAELICSTIEDRDPQV